MQDCPGCASRTISIYILKAEARAMGPILYSRAPAQTKQILSASIKTPDLEKYVGDLLLGGHVARDTENPTSECTR